MPDELGEFDITPPDEPEQPEPSPLALQLVVLTLWFAAIAVWAYVIRSLIGR